MANEPDELDNLLARLDNLLKRHEIFQNEINHFRTEVWHVLSEKRGKKTTEETTTVPVVEQQTQEVITEPVVQTEHKETPVPPVTERKPTYQELYPQQTKPLIAKKDWEKFIGENLINKIGIIITVIGVAIGAQYAIEHQLISPLTRIIFGYVIGLGLMGFAIRLKAKYENFSAVLLSGSMAILYLITYSAYSFYSLIPQGVAFGLMVLFTIFTVIAAIQYNKQVIAHVGLVGAYAVPFLLSDGSGKVVVLFTYMAIINTGILIIAFRKYWKPLLYVAFAFTWLIYASWYTTQYTLHPQLKIAALFLVIFFSIFYAAFLTYKLVRKEKFNPGDVALCLLNSIFFYGLGYALLNDNTIGKQLLGLFTLGNAIIHFSVSVVIHRNKLADRNLFYLVAGLVLVFITIAVPVQLHGHWITLLWAGEGALLYWIGTSRNVSFYRLFSYPVMLLALISLIQDWLVGYNAYIQSNPATRIVPLLNIHFLDSILVIAAFCFILYTDNKRKYTTEEWKLDTDILPITKMVFPVIVTVLVYITFLLEIMCFWDQLYADSVITKQMAEAAYISNTDLLIFKNLWCLNYTLFFLTIISVLNQRRFKNEMAATINLLLNVIGIMLFLVVGLNDISSLRDSYLLPPFPQYYHPGIWYLLMRYVCYAFSALLLYFTNRYVQQHKSPDNIPGFGEIFVHLVILWVASSELINWLSLGNVRDTYKLGLSILWGCYAALLIGFGIWKKKQHLRIAAITLFAITLLKVFFYDLGELDTISKTIVFVSLGILLLIISFLYNKYKNVINGEVEAE